MTLTNMEQPNCEIQCEANHACNIVKLIPYEHQVGGHTLMMTYDDTTICKPLNEQEHKFYHHFPDELKTFIPKLCGVVKVYYEQDEGEIHCYALPLDCSYCKDLKRLKNYLHATNASTGNFEHSSHGSEINAVAMDPNVESDNGDSYWGSKQLLLSRWKSYKSTAKLEKFILLENVLKTFKYPCSIDLKMGTRGFGDTSSKEKKERKQRRANQSTSATLGVRFCGMQVYHPNIDEYIYTNKYKGRSFNDNDFTNCIASFIYNGSYYRTDLLQGVIKKLKTLHFHMQNIDCYRFYCSSLLLTYDGDVNNTGSIPEIKVRMIDFAHACVKAESTNHHIGPDRGYILGVSSLINVFTQLLENLKNK